MRLLQPQYEKDSGFEISEEELSNGYREKIAIYKLNEGNIRFINFNEFYNDWHEIFQGDDNNTFRMGTHWKLKGEKFSCIPAFILLPEQEENINNFSVSYCNADGTEHKLDLISVVTKDGRINCFAESKIKVLVAEEKPVNNPDEASIGTVQPGFTDIIIRHNDDENFELKKKLWVCPSGVTTEQLKTIIDELWFIRNELLFLPEGKKQKAKVYFSLNESVKNNADKVSILEWIEEKLDDIVPWLERINKSPRGFLKTCKMMVPYSKIRKFTPSIIEQYIQDSGRRYYLTNNSVHSFDIYEHRILLESLIRLKEFVVKRMEFDRKEKIRISNNNEKEIARLKNTGKEGNRKRYLKKVNVDISKSLEKDSIGENCYREIIKKLDDNSSLSIFENVERAEERWRPTQIFTNDIRYHQVYLKMREIEQLLSFSSPDKNTVLDTTKLFHKKVDKLYEYWILAKILRTLIVDMGWDYKDKKSLVKIFNTFAEQNNHSDSDEDSLYVPLKHEAANLEMDLYYNTKLLVDKDEGSLAGLVSKINAYDDKEDVTKSLDVEDVLDWASVGYIYRKNTHNEMETKKVTDYRPDFLFRVRKTDDVQRKNKKKEENNDRVFILDAKYRNYLGKGGDNCWLHGDLEEVCINKYIRDINDVLGVDVTAAFIVHSDNRNDMQYYKLNNDLLEKNPHLAKHVVFNATVDPRCVNIISSDWTVDWRNHQVGSFYVVPDNMYGTDKEIGDYENNSDNNFKTFFALIFEYYMKAYNVCWNCGRSSERDYSCCNDNCESKWRVTHCKKEKHLLIQHFSSINDYHFLINQDKRPVACPVCESIKEFDYKLFVPDNEPSEYLEQMMAEIRNNVNYKEGLDTEIQNIKTLFTKEFEGFLYDDSNYDLGIKSQNCNEVHLLKMINDEEKITVQAESNGEGTQSYIHVFGKMKFKRIEYYNGDYPNYRRPLIQLLKECEQFKGMQIYDNRPIGRHKTKYIGKNTSKEKNLMHNIITDFNYCMCVYVGSESVYIEQMLEDVFLGDNKRLIAEIKNMNALLTDAFKDFTSTGTDGVIIHTDNNTDTVIQLAQLKNDRESITVRVQSYIYKSGDYDFINYIRVYGKMKKKNVDLLHSLLLNKEQFKGLGIADETMEKIIPDGKNNAHSDRLYHGV